MQITVRLFAGLSEACGSDTVTLTVAEKSTCTAPQIIEALCGRFPQAAALAKLSYVAVNQAYADSGDPIEADDEIAVIPPVSGGEAAEALYAVTYEPLSADEVARLVMRPSHGATLTFVGTTREFTYGRRTTLLEYEAYEPMALRTLRQIGEEVDREWPGTLCAIRHRLGPVAIGEASVVIAVSSPHRASCYEANRYAIERLKQIVPIWKKEIWEDGAEWQGHAQGPWNPTSPLAPPTKEGHG